MVRTNKTEFLTIAVTLNKSIPINNPTFEKSYYQAPRFEPEYFQQYYLRTLYEEKLKVPEDIEIYYCEWLIQTSDESFFKVMDVKYKEILIIFGNETIHWLYHNKENTNHINGSGELPLTWCGCCVTNQYKQILRGVMKACLIDLQNQPCYNCVACRSRRAAIHQLYQNENWVPVRSNSGNRLGFVVNRNRIQNADHNGHQNGNLMEYHNDNHDNDIHEDPIDHARRLFQNNASPNNNANLADLGYDIIPRGNFNNDDQIEDIGNNQNENQDDFQHFLNRIVNELNINNDANQASNNGSNDNEASG